MKKFLIILILTILLFPNPFCSISRAHEVGSMTHCSFTNLPIVFYEAVVAGNSLLDPVSLVDDLIVVIFSNIMPTIPLVLVVLFIEDLLKKKYLKKAKKSKGVKEDYSYLILSWVLVMAVFFGGLYLIGYLNPLEITT